MTSPNLDEGKSFLDLPPEIRLIIYHELLLDPKDHALFATSNFIRSEGLPSTIHVLFGYHDGYSGSLPYLSATALVPNVKISISIWGSRRKSEKADIIKYFGGSEVLRECCTVVLDVSWMYNFWENAADDRVFDALRTLTISRS